MCTSPLDVRWGRFVWPFSTDAVSRFPPFSSLKDEVLDWKDRICWLGKLDEMSCQSQGVEARIALVDKAALLGLWKEAIRSAESMGSSPVKHDQYGYPKQ